MKSRFVKNFARYIRNTSGVASIEFGILALPFFAVMFAAVELSYKSFVQTDLDNTLYEAASNLSTIGFDQDTSQKFVAEHICTELSNLFLTCEDIEIGVRKIPLSGRLSSLREVSIIGEWDLGCSYDALLIELNYPVTNIIHPIVVADVITRNGEKYYRSRGVVRREPLLTGPGAC